MSTDIYFLSIDFYRAIWQKSIRSVFINVVLLVLLCVTGCLKLQAQCPAGSSFRTQSQIDSFKTDYPGCTQVPGLIEISGDITNLDGLSDITSFDGGLNIYSPSLQNINGLNKVKSISNLVIQSPGILQINGFNSLTNITGDLTIANINMQSLGGFLTLTNIGGNMVIAGNKGLLAISGFLNLTTIGKWLQIVDNSILLNFDGLNELKSIGANSGLSVIISGNGQLHSLSGLNAVTKIDGTIIIQDNADLRSIDGFDSVTSLNGSLNIKSNAILERINGFNAATNIGSLLFESNNSLTDIEGFSSLTNLNAFNLINNATLRNIKGFGAVASYYLNGGINISNNPALSVCNLPFICGALKVYSNVTIANNSGNCLNNQAVLNACNIPCNAGDITFTNQQQVDDFPSTYAHCPNVSLNNVTIQGNDITNLNGLSVLKTITGSLTIQSNDSLTNLTGLSGITSLGGSLTIQSNPVLDNLKGLSGITSIVGLLRIQANTVLENISGIEKINPDSISTLIINNNPQLAICKYNNICTYVSYAPSIKPRTISFNKTTCLDVATVIDVCSSDSIPLCPNGSNSLNSSITGNNYQWQINNGSGFTNILNGGNYSGAGTSQLQLINMPSTFYGVRFRCLVDGNYTSSSILKFRNTWNGSQSSAWENTSNWGCNVLPDANTDVIIPAGVGPVQLNSTVNVRSVTLQPGANLKINPGSYFNVLY